MNTRSAPPFLAQIDRIVDAWRSAMRVSLWKGNHHGDDP